MSSEECIKLTQEDREILQRIHDTLAGEISRAEDKVMKTTELAQFTAHQYVLPSQNRLLFGLWVIIYALLIVVGLLEAKIPVTLFAYLVITMIVVLSLIYSVLKDFEKRMDNLMNKSFKLTNGLLDMFMGLLEIRLKYMGNARRRVIEKYDLDRLCPSDKVLVELINNQLGIIKAYVEGLKGISSDLKREKRSPKGIV